ncbi:MAG: bifunctional adenosylcobinamide kinase/adenosylcobinamide-phosphate guanylyltransferase [Desulfobacteraceae bacterium 4572_88]|nr:MAG: bifunctional adenosylcobinamide kinase/adenosylcobinamide-phosphate guanylyltransferase [Desulfobacteraceae bacterium 4572_88]
MKESIFVIGGCRSGKSRHALEIADQIASSKKTFIATCIPYDDEMRERVANHQQERDSAWRTVEAPTRLPDALTQSSSDADVILVDCLTLWLSNLLLELNDAEKVSEQVQSLKASLEKVQCPVILVSNEIGMGIVPENKLARQFRDVVGHANQQIAVCADRVIWMVAGIPIPIGEMKIARFR